MGSRLVDRASGKVLWGLLDGAGIPRPGLVTRFSALRVTDEERAGDTRRVHADRLLGLPFSAPVLGGREPYRAMVDGLRDVCAHPDAVREFPYDWRLSVTHNARVLADVMHRHLERWRERPEHAARRRTHPEQRDARLVLVAHSMGGLICRALGAIPGALDEVRAVVTLGTPFHGSIDAVKLLSAGIGGPGGLPTDRLREAARTMPGVHDLLPGFRCLVDNGELRVPTSADVVAIGGDPELARAAAQDREGCAAVTLPGHRLVVGVGQETAQSYRLEGGRVVTAEYTYRRRPDGALELDDLGRPSEVDFAGDGRVYRHAARLSGVQEIVVGQQHAALARAKFTVGIATGTADGIDDLGAVLGPRDIGMSLPDTGTPEAPLTMTIRDVDDPAELDVHVEDAVTEDAVPCDIGRAVPAGDRTLAVRLTFPRTGLYRVGASAGKEPVTRLVDIGGAGDAGG